MLEKNQDESNKPDESPKDKAGAGSPEPLRELRFAHPLSIRESLLSEASVTARLANLGDLAPDYVGWLEKVTERDVVELLEQVRDFAVSSAASLRKFNSSDKEVKSDEGAEVRPEAEKPVADAGDDGMRAILKELFHPGAQGKAQTAVEKFEDLRADALRLLAQAGAVKATDAAGLEAVVNYLDNVDIFPSDLILLSRKCCQLEQYRVADVSASDAKKRVEVCNKLTVLAAIYLPEMDATPLASGDD